MIDKGLPDAMKEAADTLVKATLAYNAQTGYQPVGPFFDPELQDWRPANLRSVAKQWLEDERIQLQLIEDVAEVIIALNLQSPARVAEALLAKFDIKRKEDDDENANTRR